MYLRDEEDSQDMRDNFEMLAWSNFHLFNKTGRISAGATLQASQKAVQVCAIYLVNGGFRNFNLIQSQTVSQ